MYMNIHTSMAYCIHKYNSRRQMYETRRLDVEINIYLYITPHIQQVFELEQMYRKALAREQIAERFVAKLQAEKEADMSLRSTDALRDKQVHTWLLVTTMQRAGLVCLSVCLSVCLRVCLKIWNTLRV
jgi:hypothetical protein